MSLRLSVRQGRARCKEPRPQHANGPLLVYCSTLPRTASRSCRYSLQLRCMAESMDLNAGLPRFLIVLCFGQELCPPWLYVHARVQPPPEGLDDAATSRDARNYT